MPESHNSKTGSPKSNSSETDCSKTLVTVYKSSKKEQMYLYFLKGDTTEKVPEMLMKRFGEPIFVMDIFMDESKKLARANAGEVLLKIKEQGFYLQMPPSIVDLVAHDFLDRHQ